MQNQIWDIGIGFSVGTIGSNGKPLLKLIYTTMMIPKGQWDLSPIAVGVFSVLPY